MEAWGWLEREGFVAHRPNDINGNGFLVTRAGQRVAQSANFSAWKSESMFPDGLDPIIMSSMKPMFVRGEYGTAVFRAFKEVEVRIRNKDPSLVGESGVDLMNRAFGPTGPLMTWLDVGAMSLKRSELATAAASRVFPAEYGIDAATPCRDIALVAGAQCLICLVGTQGLEPWTR